MLARAAVASTEAGIVHSRLINSLLLELSVAQSCSIDCAQLSDEPVPASETLRVPPRLCVSFVRLSYPAPAPEGVRFSHVVSALPTQQTSSRNENRCGRSRCPTACLVVPSGDSSRNN